MSGSAYAATLISSQQIQNGTIRNIDIHNGTIHSNKIHNGTIQTNDLSLSAQTVAFTTRVQSFDIGISTSAFAEVASMSIPLGGDYDVVATMTVGDTDTNNSAQLVCALFMVGDFSNGDFQEVGMTPSGTAQALTNVTLQLTPTVMGSGTVRLWCENQLPNADTSAGNVTITATSLNTITR